MHFITAGERVSLFRMVGNNGLRRGQRHFKHHSLQDYVMRGLFSTLEEYSGPSILIVAVLYFFFFIVLSHVEVVRHLQTGF
jgi:hypothetical protein